MDLLKGKKNMVWAYMGNSRMYEALRDYGDRLDTVGIFAFRVDATGTISEGLSGLIKITDMLPYINRWPHINWMLTVMNDGAASIFTALRENTNGAKTKFLSELVRIIQKYPWCTGVDIDLERGGGYENKDLANALFRDIYNTVKNHDRGKQVNICLPGMTGVQGSVGGENWCVYADLNAYCDTAAIMSYGMSWAGSAPGPVSPRSWLEGVYDYAVKAMNPSKVFMGLPGYGWNWLIHDTPENLGRAYRGTSNTYYAASLWLSGAYNFTDDGPPQPLIPIIAYWDDVDKVPWALPHVYDFMNGWQYTSTSGALRRGTYNRRRYLTCYGKVQKSEFGTIYVDRNGVPDSYSGIVTVTDTMTVLGEGGSATFNFTVSQAGTYDVAVRLCYPFWDKNALTVSLDGSSKTFRETRLWWPYWRKTCWLPLSMRVNLSAGSHTIRISGGVPGVQFYGFRVCGGFAENTWPGEATYTLAPRRFIDVDGNPAAPANGFKLTFEMLRRKPDSALVWYEDFRDTPPIPSTFWRTLDGKWEVWQDYSSMADRPYSQLEGSGRFAWQYESFTDLHLRAQVAFPANGSGRAGVFIGDVFACLNIDTQRVELYQGSSLLGSYSTSFSKTSDANIRNNPSMYSIEMRKRGNRVRVYSGANSTLRFTATVSAAGGFAGIRSDAHIKCQLLRLGDAWAYEPYERFDVEYPDGSSGTFGRIARSGVTWDEEFQVFTVNSDVEESSTHSEDISLEYEFFHSKILPLSCGNDYRVTVRPRDINLWTVRLLLGDADGFSILYYSDVDSLVYWANEAAYRWKLRGFALWSLGQEDMRLWEALPKQIT